MDKDFAAYLKGVKDDLKIQTIIAYINNSGHLNLETLTYYAQFGKENNKYGYPTN